jgi:hypothetical protein
MKNFNKIPHFYGFLQFDQVKCLSRYLIAFLFYAVETLYKAWFTSGLYGMPYKSVLENQLCFVLFRDKHVI